MVVSALAKEDAAIKIRIFELLSAICVYSPEGYERVIDVLELYKVRTQTYLARLYMIVHVAAAYRNYILGAFKSPQHMTHLW